MSTAHQDAQHLQQLDAQIEARVQAIRAEHDWFPCRRGCDHCCRHLAHPPELSAIEWARVDAALAQLPAPIQGEIEQNIQALLLQLTANHKHSSIVCPYLNQTEGTCFIYGDRPLACRTYGFFIARDHDQYCQQIAAEVAARPQAAIVWGNAEAMDWATEQISGPPISFVEHYCATSN
jgi:Fe-S-cluster containining protein